MTKLARPELVGREGSLSLALADSNTGTESREEMRAFLQRRIAQFGRLMALLFGMFFVWRIFMTIVGDDNPSAVYLPWQALSVSSFASMWLLCRGRLRSLRFIRAVEMLGLVGAGTGAVAMCFHISYMARPDSILLLCLSYTLITRSIMVPSSARRTFLYGAAFALPYLASVYNLHLLGHDPSIYSELADPRLRLPSKDIASRFVVVGVLWWTASLIIATAASKVIYGLRKEVRDARRLGQYTLTEKLGQGGMGVVYLARHALLRRPSAIKLLLPERFGGEAVARFEREVQLTAGLSHPNTIRVFDYGRTPDGLFYYVMEYLEGASLDDVVALAGPMPAARVIHILDQVAGALSEAHGVGLIHRDIKPANIFLTQLGGVPDVAKVLDFGLVKQLSRTSGEDATVQQLTRDESISGTPLYMAPEAITTPDRIDGRTDLYSLGAVGYYLLTGHDVFGGRNVLEICGHHLHSLPSPPSERVSAAIPTDLEAVIMSCLRKSAAERPADARALQQALRACRDARSWDEGEARSWFATHGEALRAKQARTGISGAATVAIDLAVRWHESPEDVDAKIA